MKKIKNSDFIIHLPDEVAGRELAANDSVELRIYTVNADNYYKFEYEGGQVPEEQKVDASCMATMESGVVMYLLLAHIADASMPDGYFDLQEEITSDYYWIKTQEQSAQEQINELRKDILEEAEVREAADDQLSKSIDSLSDDLDSLSDQVDDLEAIHAADIEALSGAVSSMTSRLDQIDADQETQDGRISKAVDAIGDLDSRLSAENLAQDTKIQSLSGAIETESLVRDKTIFELSATHADDIKYINQRIDNESSVRSKAIYELSATHAEDIENLNQRIDNIDLDGYVSQEDYDSAQQATSAALNELKQTKLDSSDIDNYYNKSEIDAMIGDINAALSNINGV